MGTLEEDGGLGYGSSLPVPSVQEMVLHEAKKVPEKYIQENENRPLTFKTLPLSLEIPIIDYSLICVGDEDERQKLDFACKEWGFFQMIHHGEKESVNKLKAVTSAFFDLPLSEKMKYATPTNDVQGYGQVYVVSQEQKLDWNDMLGLMIFPAGINNMKYWPVTIAGFKEAVEEYSSAMERLTDGIITNLSLLMKNEDDFLKELHGDMKLAVRMNLYPACARPDLVLGVSPHTDSCSITLLVQDDDITGLQIRHKKDWVPVKPIPNAIVVNIGDAMEAWSNGKYKSIEHRAVTNEEKPRISVATFVGPGNEVQLNPIKTMVEEAERMLYRNDVNYGDYLRYTFSRKLDGKANIEYLKLEI